MIPCDRMFNGEGSCVENGITFFRRYIPDWTGNDTLTFHFVSADSPHPQGIWITRGPGFRGEMLLGDRPLPPLKTRFAHDLFRARNARRVGLSCGCGRQAAGSRWRTLPRCPVRTSGTVPSGLPPFGSRKPEGTVAAFTATIMMRMTTMTTLSLTWRFRGNDRAKPSFR